MAVKHVFGIALKKTSERDFIKATFLAVQKSGRESVGYTCCPNMVHPAYLEFTSAARGCKGFETLKYKILSPC